MTSIRQQKVARLIQKELSDIFQREGFTLFGGSLVSVTVVRMSPDLALARVYLSGFSPAGKKDFIGQADENKKHIRHVLGQKVRHQVRIVPELAFFEDDSLEYAENIENLLK